jgi:hypothetical protein
MSKKNSNTYRITDQLMEPYFIQYDQNCYTVMKKVTAGDTGRDREQLVGYYTALNACLDSIAKDSIKNQDYNSLQGFIEAQKNRLQELKEISLK